MSESTKPAVATSSRPGFLSALLHDRVPAKAKMEAWLDRPDAATYVPQLDALELFNVITDVGLSDAQSLALLASPDQVQRFVDFDTWRRDRFHPARLERWIETYLALDDEPFAQWAEGLDPEVLPLFLKHHVQVFMAEDGGPPEGIPGLLEASPDGAYYVRYPHEAKAARLCRTLIQKVYATLGVMVGWRMLESTRWELNADLEEHAFRFRKARLEESGFRSFEDALEVLSFVDPNQLREDAEDVLAQDAMTLSAGDGWVHRALPDEIVDALVSAHREEENYLTRCLDAVDAAQSAALTLQLTTLINTIGSAQGAEPGDRLGLRRVSKHAAGMLSVGLEFLSRGDRSAGVKLLQGMALRKIYQSGHSLVLQLKRQAERLVEDERLTLTDAPASLLRRGEQELVEGLIKTHPVRVASSSVPFGRYAEIEAAALTLSAIAFRALVFYDLLRMDRATLAAAAYQEGLVQTPDAITFDVLVATLVLNMAVTGEVSLSPVDVGRVPRRVDALHGVFEAWTRRHFAERALATLGRRWMSHVEAQVRDDVVTPTGALEPRYITAFLTRLGISIND